MKRAFAILVIAAFLLAALLPLAFSIKSVSAQGAGYSIQNVDHQVEVMYSGNVVIRDTVSVSGQITEGFLIGFPYKYGSYLLKGMAFDSKEVFPMSLGVQLGERSGFYGAEITFPNGSPQVFTVVFVFSNTLLTSVSGGFYLDFPAYPSFALDAARCNVTIVVPQEASVFEVTKDDGTVETGKFVKDNLAAFAYFPGNASISLPEGWIRQIDVSTLNRVVTLDTAGGIKVSDTYRIVNNSTNPITSLKLDVPVDSSNIAARDEIGTVLKFETLSRDAASTATSVNVTLTGPLRSGQTIAFIIDYILPGVTVDQARFTMNLELFPYFSYYVRQASITVVPPEGAHIATPQLSSVVPSLTLGRELFQETLQVNSEGLSYVDRDVPSETTLQIAYDYNPLWLSLRPTFWVWGLSAVGSIIVVFNRRRPKTSKPTKPERIAVPKLTRGRLGPDQIKTFVDAHDEKNKISSEIKLLVDRAQKGRIPRRQYKVQRRALELRRDSLSKNIVELKAMFRSAGGNYADLIRQLDTAEAELYRVEANMRSAEARRATGELPLEEYKKSVADLQRRKEKAESAISGILLRLREETR